MTLAEQCTHVWYHNTVFRYFWVNGVHLKHVGVQLHESLHLNCRKIMDSFVSGDVVLIFEAIQNLHDDNPNSRLAYDVILTDNCLLLLEKINDSEQQVFSLADVQCCPSKSHSDVIYITVNSANPEDWREVCDVIIL